MRKRRGIDPGAFGTRVIENHELVVALEAPRYQTNGRVCGNYAAEELRDVLTRDGVPVVCVWTHRQGPFFRTEVVRFDGRLPWAA